MKVPLACVLCLVLILPGTAASNIETSAHEGVTGRSVPTFFNVTRDAGLGGVYGNYFAWADYDIDGHQDLLVGGQRLFRNGGPPEWKFTEVTSRAGTGGTGVNNGVWADYDNDGRPDIYCPSGGWSTDYDPREDILWHNNGDGTFSNVTRAAGGVTDTFPSVAAGWGDFNRDGYVDLYVANYENASMSSYYPDVFWKNNGDGTFTNWTSQSGLDETESPRPGRGVSWCDYNNDGWQDILVPNYRLKANYLYRNNRDGTFTEVASSAGVAGEPTNRLGETYYGHSVGACWADYNNDGTFDLWNTNLAHKDAYRGPICDDSELYRNNGPPGYNFTDVRPDAGIPVKRVMGGEDELMVGCCWGDFNNDGYTDLFIPQIYNDVAYAYSYIYLNNGNGTFTEVSNQTGVRVYDTYGGCWCDYDEDGDLDLLTGGKGDAGVNTTHEIHLYSNTLNDGGAPGRWLELNLRGIQSNRLAMGARVYATAGGLTQMREVEGGMGPHSMENSFTLEFGFPGNPQSVELKVRWPTGKEETIKGVALDQILELEEGATEKPDLVAEVFSLASSSVTEGENQRWCVTFSNRGTGIAQFCRLSLYDNEISDTTRFYTENRSHTMAPGFINTTFGTYPTAGKGGSHILMAVIDAAVPAETNTSNNRLDARCTVLKPGTSLPPVASLTVNPQTVRIGENAQLDATGSYDPDGTVVEYEFSFGDGGSSGWTSNPYSSHTYSQAGTYTAGLRVRDNSSALSTNPANAEVTVRMTANKVPSARIVNILPSPAIAGQAVSFMGDAFDEDGKVVAYSWSSSIDGNISTQPGFSSAELSTGTHTISFRARDDRGDWSTTATRPLDVRVPPPNQPPRAILETISPSSVLQGQAVTFSGRGEDDDGRVVELDWYSSIDGKLGTGSPLVVTNLSAGSHQIRLNARDDDGAYSQDAVASLKVRAPPEPETPNQIPRASMSVSSVSSRLMQVLVFDGSASTDSDGRVMEYLFDFGDGSEMCWTISDTVTHAYSTPGQYVARLKVRDDGGARSGWSREIIIDVKAVKQPAPATRKFIPGFEGPALLLAMIASVALLGNGAGSGMRDDCRRRPGRGI